MPLCQAQDIPTKKVVAIDWASPRLRGRRTGRYGPITPAAPLAHLALPKRNGVEHTGRKQGCTDASANVAVLMGRRALYRCGVPSLKRSEFVATIIFVPFVRLVGEDTYVAVCSLLSLRSVDLV